MVRTSTTGTASSAPASRASYQRRVDRLLNDYARVPLGRHVRLAKPTSNLFRVRDRDDAARLDVDGFAGVLEIDEDSLTADVLGMTTYRDLVAATLPRGLAPLVVPQLGTITLGGAVAGLGIESTSFRAGCPHESVREMDVLTGDGRVLTATSTNEHAALFRGFPNSYGTLGYALRLSIELERVKPYVHLRHVRHRSVAAAVATIEDVVRTGELDGIGVDYLDGVVLARDLVVLTLGRGVPAAPYASDYTGQGVYWRSLAERAEDYLTIHDYLWRWDTDWFWCSRAFGVQHPIVRPLVPPSMKRSEVYWSAMNRLRRGHVIDRADTLLGRRREFVIQDVEVPVERLAHFMDFFHDEVGMLPIWLCPIRQRDPAARWSTFALEPDTTYVNVGFWGSVYVPPGTGSGWVNQRIEHEVGACGGHKSLYSDSFYDRDEFERLYGGAAYAALKQQYDADHRLQDMFSKCVRNH